MNTVYFLIGGNLGHRTENLNEARNCIEREIGKIISLSSIYETASWGIAKQQDFLNQVLIVETKFFAEEIMKIIFSIESKMGRVRTIKNASRIIDIDILFFNDAEIDLPEITIPHPEIQNRKFTLVPLAELSPQLIHPGLKKTISQLLADCKDDLEVKLFKMPVHKSL